MTDKKRRVGRPRGSLGNRRIPKTRDIVKLSQQNLLETLKHVRAVITDDCYLDEDGKPIPFTDKEREMAFKMSVELGKVFWNEDSDKKASKEDKEPTPQSTPAKGAETDTGLDLGLVRHDGSVAKK